MLRITRQIVARVACWTVPRYSSQAVSSQRALLCFTGTPFSSVTACFCQSTQEKDYALPNSSWSQEMMTLFNRFMEMSKDGTWKRLPSYRNIVDHMPARMRQRCEMKMNSQTRLFLRNIDGEGLGFEYVMFLNPTEKRVVCVFQPGPYLEGPPGFAHGGSIATILDSTLGGCALFHVGKVMTANLNVNFKNPIPLGSVVLVDCKLDKTEGKKVFVSGQVWSADGETLHTEATALFIQLVSQKFFQQPESSM